MTNKEKSISKLRLDGGILCFDFINTIHSRNEENSHDYIKCYEDFIEWCEKVELLSGNQVNELKLLVVKNPKKSKKNLKIIKEAREILYLLFSNYSSKNKIDNEILEKYNSHLQQAFSKLVIKQTTDGVRVSLINEVDFLFPLRIIMKSSYDALTTFPRERIKECTSCGWIFLDKTKNAGRKWCNMKTCGSIDKSLRYYYRKKGAKK